MAMIDVPRTDRRLVNLPDVRTYRDNPGERWGVLADTAGKSFGGVADGLDAIGRIQAARARAAEADARRAEMEREEKASLLASRYRAHSRNGWNGYLERDAHGNEVRVKGAGEKTYGDYGDGETPLGDIERIDESFRERDDYRGMDAATREAFERKIAPVRDEMMQLAQRKAFSDRVAKGKAAFDEKVREWGQEVETTFGLDDSAYASASEQNSIREAVATFGYGEVANAAELDGMKSVSVEDVRFANDPTGAKARRLRQLVDAKQKVYDRAYFDALCASAAGCRALGGLTPEQCAAKAAEFAAGMGETEAERADLAGKAEKARLHMLSVQADARAESVRANRHESARRQDEFYKGGPAPSAFPAFLDSEAEAAEKAGDFEAAVEFRRRSARIGEELEKSARAAEHDALQDAMRREEIELYRGGREPTLEEKRAFDVRWQRVLEERDAKAALARAKSASGLSGDIAERDRRAFREELERNYDKLMWMRIAEQDLRAKGDVEGADNLLHDIDYEFGLMRAGRRLSPSAVESFRKELARVPGSEEAVLLRMFDRAFDMVLDEDGDGTVSASEVRAFGKSGDEFEPDWAKGDTFDARTRLRLRGEFAARMAALPPKINRREAAETVLKEFRTRYVQGKAEDSISYLSTLVTDMVTAEDKRYMGVRARRAAAADRAEAERARRAERVYATPEAAARLDAEERAGQAGGFGFIGTEPWNL